MSKDGPHSFKMLISVYLLLTKETGERAETYDHRIPLCKEKAKRSSCLAGDVLALLSFYSITHFYQKSGTAFLCVVRYKFLH